ncbi:hypothetical protein QUA56_27140 [Microcoleus sp. N3A4]
MLLEIFFESIEKFGGKVIKTIGDAVMAASIGNEQAIMTKNFLMVPAT